MGFPWNSYRPRIQKTCLTYSIVLSFRWADLHREPGCRFLVTVWSASGRDFWLRFRFFRWWDHLLGRWLPLDKRRQARWVSIKVPSSYLDMRENEIFLKYYLLCLHEISYVSIIIYSSGIESGAGFLSGTPRYHNVLQAITVRLDYIKFH